VNWSVYIILCTDNSLYTGITTDIGQRFQRHKDLQGAKYFRGRQPERLVYIENGHDRSSASKREFAIKKLNHVKKWQLIASDLNKISESVF
jgi:putative endonuclease